MDGKPAQPVVVRRLLCVPLLFNAREVRLHLRQTFRLQFAGNLGVRHRQTAHGIEGRQPVDRCALLCVVVLGAELMQPHEVERIDQNAAARVGRMMGIQESAVIVEHRAARCAALCIGVAVGHIGFTVHARQELLHCRRHVIRSAERTDNAGLLARVALLLCAAVAQLRLAGHGRPTADVPPVLVQCQHTVRREERLVLVPENILGIRAGARPVHQALDLERGRIEPCHFRLNQLGQSAADRLVLVRLHGAVGRRNNTQTRCFRAVLARGIHAVADTQTGTAPQDLCCRARRQVVEVEGHEIAPLHVCFLTPSGKLSADKAADVLAVVPLGLAHLHIGRECFLAADRRVQAVIQFSKGHDRRLPVRTLAPGTG